MLYDLIFIGIIILAFVAGYRKGAAKTLLSLGVFLASLVLAILLSRPLSQLIYSAFFKSALESKIADFVVESPAGAVVFEATAFLASLPQMLLEMLKSWGRTEHLTSDSFASFADSANSATAMVEDMVSPVITAIISGVVCILLFIVLRFVLGLATRGIAKVFRLPLLRIPDSLLGGAIGLLKGTVIVVAIFVLLELLYPFLYRHLGFIYTGMGNSLIVNLISEVEFSGFIYNLIYGI